MVKPYIPDRGDLVWLDLDPTRGHEQKGRRPVLVLSSKIYNSTGMALVTPVTSQAKGYVFEVPVETSKVEGVVLSDQIRTIDWFDRPIRFIQKAGEETLRHVQENLIKLVKG